LNYDLTIRCSTLYLLNTEDSLTPIDILRIWHLRVLIRGRTEVTIEYVILNKLAFFLEEIPSFELKLATKLRIGKDDVFVTSLLDLELLEVVGVPAFSYMRVMVSFDDLFK